MSESRKKTAYRAATLFLAMMLAASSVVNFKQARQIREQADAIEGREIMLSGALDLLKEQNAALNVASQNMKLCEERY